MSPTKCLTYLLHILRAGRQQRQRLHDFFILHHVTVEIPVLHRERRFLLGGQSVQPPPPGPEVFLLGLGRPLDRFLSTSTTYNIQ